MISSGPRKCRRTEAAKTARLLLRLCGRTGNGTLKGHFGGRRLPARQNARRASTFIIVLALLSILVLVATALSLTSRLEVISAANYAEAIQARTAAKTGLNLASLRSVDHVGASRAASSSSASSSQASAKASSDLIDTDMQALESVLNVSLAEVSVRDASARVNINTASAETLESIFRVAMNRAQVSEGDPAALAAVIVNSRNTSVRLSQDISGAASEARTRRAATYSSTASSSSAASNSSGLPLALNQLSKNLPPDPLQFDLRFPPLREEHRIQSITDLLEMQGATPALVAAAARYLTTFSCASETADLASGARPLTDLNTAGVTEIYLTLQSIYGASAKSDRLLKQFAVNIVDWRDADSIPSTYPGLTGTDAIIGFERTPLITEIWPNSIDPTEANGAGQYIEIHNPWQDEWNLMSWSVTIDGNAVPLRGTLPSGGYLLITDIFEDSTPESSRSPYNSFYSIFNMVASGSSQRILEADGLQIPWSIGTHLAELRDNQGRLIDTFAYTVKASLRDQKTSYQRMDPRVRATVAATCTPLGPPRGADFFRESAATSNGAERIPVNRPFINRTEILNVLAGWSNPAQSAATAALPPIPAVPESPDSKLSAYAARIDYLDARLLDGFAVDIPTLRDLLLGGETASTKSKSSTTAGSAASEAWSTAWKNTSSSASASENASVSSTMRNTLLSTLASRLQSPSDRAVCQKALAENDTLVLAALASRAAFQQEAWTRLGAVNLNTAPEAVLESLPGLDATIAQSWAEKRKVLNQDARLAPLALFKRPSDLLADQAFWTASTTNTERLQRLTSVLDAATFSSRSVLLESRTTVAQVAGSTRRPATSRARALAAFDRGVLEFVAWSQWP